MAKQTDDVIENATAKRLRKGPAGLKFYKVSKKRIPARNGKLIWTRKAGGVVPFESEFIPPALMESINGSIKEFGVEAAFEFLKKKN